MSYSMTFTYCCVYSICTFFCSGAFNCLFAVVKHFDKRIWSIIIIIIIFFMQGIYTYIPEKNYVRKE